MTDEEIINNEKYHTCGRCKYEYTPDNKYPCNSCIYGTDNRTDLWELKRESEEEYETVLLTKSFDEVKNEPGNLGDCLVKTEEFLEWIERGTVTSYDGAGEIHNGDKFVTEAFKDNIFDFIREKTAKMTKEEFINKYPYVAWYNK